MRFCFAPGPTISKGERERDRQRTPSAHKSSMLLLMPCASSSFLSSEAASKLALTNAYDFCSCDDSGSWSSLGFWKEITYTHAAETSVSVSITPTWRAITAFPKFTDLHDDRPDLVAPAATDSACNKNLFNRLQVFLGIEQSERILLVTSAALRTQHRLNARENWTTAPVK